MGADQRPRREQPRQQHVSEIAGRAAGAGEALGEDAAFEVTPGFPFHAGWHALPVPGVFPRQREVGLQVLRHDLIAAGLLRTVTAIRNRSTSL